jgi:lipid-A-disaccharide synthase
VPKRVLISAGEASGDLYASALIRELSSRYFGIEFFGCAGPRMQAAGVRTVVDAHSLAVVGLMEVVAHLPRIYGEFRKLVHAAERERPDIAILTDSPDFNLRLAKRLKELGIPVVYLVAPQVWAWRKGRLKTIRRTVDLLLCIFPFEERFFRDAGVNASYIGHPLTRIVKQNMDKAAFRDRVGAKPGQQVVALLPGSRPGEIARHLPALAGAVDCLRANGDFTFVVGAPPGFSGTVDKSTFWERIRTRSIQVVEGSTWDLLAHADLALAASGTVTVEAAVLGTPTVAFYRVAGLSWRLGRSLVRVPFFSMVNLIAERKVVPELIQENMTGETLCAEAMRLLTDPGALQAMRAELGEVRRRLESDRDPMQAAADLIRPMLEQ